MINRDPVIFSRAGYNAALAELALPPASNRAAELVDLDLLVCEMEGLQQDCEDLVGRVQVVSWDCAQFQQDEHNAASCARAIRAAFELDDLSDLVTRLNDCSLWCEVSLEGILELQERVEAERCHHPDLSTHEAIEWEILSENVPGEWHGKLHKAYLVYEAALARLDFPVQELNRLSRRVNILLQTLHDASPQLDWLADDILPNLITVGARA